MSRMFNDYFFDSGMYLVEEAFWAPTEYDGYFVCEEGYVLGPSGRVLKPHKGDRHGHLNVRCMENGIVHEEYIHRLVARAFIPNPNNYPYVRHLDDDPRNNHADNLDWGTQYHNHLDAVRNGTYRPFTDEDREKSYSKSRRPIVAISLSTGEELYFKGENEAARILDLQQSNIYKVLTGERRQTGGWAFRFSEDYHD